MHFSAFLTGALATALVAAHPGDDEATKQMERMARRSFLESVERRDLSHCAAKLKARGVEARSVQRRAEKLAAIRREMGLPELVGRDLTAADALNTSHLSGEDYTLDTSEETIFASNSSCVLSPEVTEGPYYVAGEYILANITQGQVGVPVHLELQVVDVETCEPIDNVYAEIWACNSTGVYSGVSASGNGNSATDTSNLNATFLRGAQLTDDDGVAAFDTLFPGHYTGRTTHYHVAVHLNATAQANGTLLDTTVSHVGQMFYDQDLIYEVEATTPYSTNTQDLTLNSEDSILTQEATGSDPMIEYVLLGDTIADGLLGWLSFGVNTSYTGTINAAAYYYATGGESSSSSGGGGSGGPGGEQGGGSGGFPGGF